VHATREPSGDRDHVRSSHSGELETITIDRFSRLTKRSSIEFSSTRSF
jgi:hypothetical protein